MRWLNPQPKSKFELHIITYSEVFQIILDTLSCGNLTLVKITFKSYVEVIVCHLDMNNTIEPHDTHVIGSNLQESFL